MKENIHITRNNIASGELDPTNNIIPKFIGQQYIMTSEDKVFFAKGLTSEDWIEASSSGLKSIPNTEHQTENGVKKFESTKGYVDNISIEGETLVNIVDKLYRINGKLPDGIVRTRFSEGGDNFNHNTKISQGTWTFYNMTDKTISFVGTDTSDNWVNNAVGDLQAYSYKTVTLDGTYCIAGADFRPENGWSNSDLSIFNETMIMVIPGEHKELPYFKGTYSAGQDNGINLMTLGEKIDLSNLTWIDGHYIDGPNGYDSAGDIWSYTTDYIPVEDTCEYYMFANKNMCFYDKDKRIIPTQWQNANETIPMKDYYTKYNDQGGHIIVRPPKGCCYIRINQLTTLKDLTEMYKRFEKKEISTVLRSLPNGVKDTIKKIGDKYYKIQRCGEYTFTGEENFKDEVSHYNDVTIKPMAAGFMKKIGAKNTGGDVVDFYCNNFETAVIHRGAENTKEGIYYSGSDTVHLRIYRSKANDLNKFKSWLKDNPTTIVYELETPIITELEDFSLRTFEGETTFLVDAGIIKDYSFETTNSLVEDIEIIKEKVRSLEDVTKEKRIEKNSYSTFNGDCEFMSKDGYIDNIAIEGNVLVNYMNNIEKRTLIESTGQISTANGTLTKSSSGIYSYTASGDWDDIGQIVPVKASTTYTFSTRLIENNNVKCNMVVMFFSSYPKLDTSGVNESIRIDISKKAITTHDIHYHTFTTPANCTHVLCATSFEKKDLTYKTCEYMLTEGITHYPYFEGMISAGEKNINILTYNSERSLYPREFDKDLIMNEYIESNPTMTNFGTVVNNQWICRTRDCILVEPNTMYVLPYANGNINQYDEFGQLLTVNNGTKYLSGDFKVHKPVVALYTSSETRYVRITLEKQYIGKVEMYKVEKCDNRTIPVALRSLLDKKDRIFKLNNSYYKESVAGIHQCTSADPIVNNNIEVHGDYTRFALEYQANWEIVKAERRNSWCDKFPVGAVYNANILQEGHYTSGGGRIYFKVANSRLTSSDEAGIKAFLDKEKPIVVYELATPKLEKIPNLDCLTFDGKTTLIISSGVAQLEATFETTNINNGFGSKINDIDNSINSIGTSIDNMNTSITNMNSRIKNITYSTSEPTASQGQDGDLWIIYEA